MLRDEGPLTPVAGCTDVYVSLQFGTLADKRFVDLWPLPELRGIADDRGTLRIGALTTYTDLIQSPLVRRRVPMLVAASREIGGRQIQNRGHARRQHRQRVAGRRFVAGARGRRCDGRALSSASGERRVPFNSFYTGYRTSVRRPDEIIVAIEVPRIEGTQYWRKVGTRRAQAISKVMCAAVRGPEVRVALGSVAPTVVRLRRTERVLTAGSPLKQAQAVMRGEIHADRRPPLDGRLSTRGQRQPARRFLACHAEEVVDRSVRLARAGSRALARQRSPSLVCGSVQRPRPSNRMATLVEILRPALPFPVADVNGDVPVRGGESVQVVCGLARRPMIKRFVVRANPLHRDTQASGAEAMARIQEAVVAAERKAQAAYDRAIKEAATDRERPRISMASRSRTKASRGNESMRNSS